MVFSSSIGSVSQRRLRQIFEDEWARGVSLHINQIEKYKRARPKINRRAAQLKIPLREILGASPIHRKAVEQGKGERQYWRDYIKGYFQNKTMQILYQTTNWHEKGYDFYSAGKHPYKSGDRLLLFDFTVNRLYIVEIKALTEISTPDGRYFVAHKPVRGIPKKHLTKKLWQRLKSSGFVNKKADAYQRRKLSEMKWHNTLELLKEK